MSVDGFPKLKILATASSTLAASKKFRDTLTGRKRLVHLTPSGNPAYTKQFGKLEAQVCTPAELRPSVTG
jgi:hypothetical protein